MDSLTEFSHQLLTGRLCLYSEGMEHEGQRRKRMKKCYLLEDTEVNLQLCANCLRSGACNNIPQPGWREPQTLISHSPEAGCLRPGACVVGWWCLHCSWGADGCLLCVLAGGRGREGARPASAHKDTNPSCNSTLRISSKLVTSRRPHLQIPAP